MGYVYPPLLLVLLLYWHDISEKITWDLCLGYVFMNNVLMNSSQVQQISGV